MWALTTHQHAVLIGSYSAMTGEPKGAELLIAEEFSHPRFGGDRYAQALDGSALLHFPYPNGCAGELPAG